MVFARGMGFLLFTRQLPAGDVLRPVSGCAAAVAQRSGRPAGKEMESGMKLPTGIGGWLKATLPWVLLAVLLLLPATHPSDNLIRVLLITAVWTTTSLGWDLLGGMAGQDSLGVAVVFRLGAYTTALLMLVGHSPYFGFAGAPAIAILS